MALSNPPPTQKISEDDGKIAEPWYRWVVSTIMPWVNSPKIDNGGSITYAAESTLDNAWELTNRDNITVPVAVFRPLSTAGKQMALDVMPRTTAAVADNGEGVSWIDICSEDFKDISLPFTGYCARVGVWTDKVEFGSHVYAYNSSGNSTSGTAKPIAFGFHNSNAGFVEHARMIPGGATVIGSSTSSVMRDRGNGAITPLVQSHGTNGSAGYGVARYSNGANGTSIVIAKSRNATLGSHTIVNNGDELGNLVWNGSDGEVFRPGAAFRCIVDGAPSTNSVPAAIQVLNNTSGGTAPTVSATFKADGGLILGTGTTSPKKGNLALGTGQAVSALPASPTKGMIAVVTDSSTATWGAAIGGGGATSVLAWYNGTNWTVIGS